MGLRCSGQPQVASTDRAPGPGGRRENKEPKCLKYNELEVCPPKAPRTKAYPPA